MFRRKYKKRYTFVPLLIFRLLLSLTIFATLLGGVYYAYREFSGYDPVKLSPQSVLLFLSTGSKDKFLEQLGELINSDLSKGAQKVIPKAPNQSGQSSRNQPVEKPAPAKKLAFKFAIVADSHSDNELLAKALAQAAGEKVEFIIGLGDYTEVGTMQELENAKARLASSGIRYFTTAGDHDLWDSRNKSVASRTNFNKVLGSSYSSFEHLNARFIILDNSDNYLGVDGVQMKWLEDELGKLKQSQANARFVMLHEPLYHPSSERVMGKVEPKLKDQAKDLIKRFKNAGITEVFAGDVHFFTRYFEPGTKLPMTTIGAITGQRNTQSPRFGIVSVYEDGSYSVDDIEIK